MEMGGWHLVSFFFKLHYAFLNFPITGIGTDKTAPLGDKAGEQGRKRLHSEEVLQVAVGSLILRASQFPHSVQLLLPFSAAGAHGVSILTRSLRFWDSLSDLWDFAWAASLLLFFSFYNLSLHWEHLIPDAPQNPNEDTSLTLDWQDPEAGNLLDIHPSGPSPKTWLVSLALTWHQAGSTHCLFQSNIPWTCMGFFVHRRDSSQQDAEIL